MTNNRKLKAQLLSYFQAVGKTFLAILKPETLFLFEGVKRDYRIIVVVALAFCYNMYKM